MRRIDGVVEIDGKKVQFYKLRYKNIISLGLKLWLYIKDFKCSDIVGKELITKVSLTLPVEKDGKQVIKTLEIKATVARFYIVEHDTIIVLRDKMHFLRFDFKLRVFENMQVNSLYAKVFGAGRVAIEDKSTTGPTCEYQSQVCESSYRFVTRKMAENGHYFLCNENGKVTIADGFNKHNKYSPKLQSIRSTVRFRHSAKETSAFAFDFKKSEKTIKAQSSKQVGHYSIESITNEFVDENAVARLAKSTLSYGGFMSKMWFVETLQIDIAVGDILSDSEGNNLVCIEKEVEIGKEIKCLIKLIRNSEGFALKRRKNPNPGALNAKVIGGKDNEIVIDKLGRIKVQLFYETQAANCWVRLCHFVSGTNYGTWFVPRVGNEVVIVFFQNNPDQPLCIGSLYNNANTFHSQQNAEQISYIKTSTTGTKGEDNKNDKFENMILFCDKPNAEQMLFSSKKDMLSKVTQNYNETVMGEVELAHHKNLKHLVKGNVEWTIEGSLKVKITGDLTVEAANINVTAKQNTSVDSKQNIKLKSMSYSNESQQYKNESSMVNIKGKQMIDIKSDGCLSEAGKLVTLKGDSVLQIKGTLVELKGSGFANLSGGMLKLN